MYVEPLLSDSSYVSLVSSAGYIISSDGFCSRLLWTGTVICDDCSIFPELGSFPSTEFFTLRSGELYCIQASLSNLIFTVALE